MSGLTRRFVLVDVFTDRAFGGNPLAVFPEADGLTGSQMGRIAGELNLSETVFVHAPLSPEASARLRIFTPRIELPFAGHPTVGAACVLGAEGRLGQGEEIAAVFEENVGLVPVWVRRAGAGFTARFRTAVLPERGPPAPAREALAGVLSLDPDQIGHPDCAPATLSCGVPFTIVPVRDRAALDRARLDGARWEAVLRDSWAPHVYAVSDPGAPVVHARMFAPAMGIAEDPATGAAAAAFAGLVRPPAGGAGGGGGTVTARRTIRQGEVMGRPSTLDLEVDFEGRTVTAVRIGGATASVGTGELVVPPE